MNDARPARRVSRMDTPPPFSGNARPYNALVGDKRLARVQRLGWLLDRSIPIGPWRVGIDPIIGLMPGIGDALAAFFSFFILFEGARLGMPGHVLGRMLANIAIEALVGAVPVVGDAFDFVWQANMRNVRLIERHYDPLQKSRPLGRILLTLTVAAILLMVVVIALALFIARALWAWASNTAW